MNRAFSIFILMVGFLSCSEAPLFSAMYTQSLNAPASITPIASTDLALVSNTNISLQEQRGSILGFDLSSTQLLNDTRFLTTNFGARPWVDDVNSRILIPDLDRYLLFYNYQVPGDDGTAVSFEKETVTPIINEDLTNALEMDEIPSDVTKVSTSAYGDLYVIANQLGTLTLVEVDTLEVMNLNDEERYQGFRLTSSLTIDQQDGYPAQGVSRIVTDEQSGLLYVINPSNNLIYLFDPEHIENEGVISLISTAGNATGVRSMRIDDSQRAFISHGGLESIIVLDVSSIADNGISFEVIEPEVITIIPMYGLPNDLVLNGAQDTAFVSLQDTNEVVQIDLASMSVVDRLTLSTGRGPSSLYFNEDTSEILSMDFFSSTITRIDATNLSEIEVIQ